MSSKVLVIYYSHSENTSRIARIAARYAEADLVRIEPVHAYPWAYQAVLDQARKEIRAGYHPPIRPLDLKIDQYDTVLVGTPNWCGTLAPPVETFLENYDYLSNKKTAVFCTHGGGGLRNVAKDFAARCSNAAVQKELSVYEDGGSDAERIVENWISALGLL